MNMKATTVAVTAVGFAGAATACTGVTSVQITFYGYPDIDPSSTQIAYDCGRSGAGGTGTYSDPLTMATASGELNKCEVVYIPYLKKYLRFEDTCAQCTTDYKNGLRHIDIWTGNSNNGGQEQINCEDSLTPDAKKGIIRNPATNYAVDTTALYSKGASTPCRTSHGYNLAKNADYCSS